MTALWHHSCWRSWMVFKSTFCPRPHTKWGNVSFKGWGLKMSNLFTYFNVFIRYFIVSTDNSALHPETKSWTLNSTSLISWLKDQAGCNVCKSHEDLHEVNKERLLLLVSVSKISFHHIFKQKLKVFKRKKWQKNMKTGVWICL